MKLYSPAVIAALKNKHKFQFTKSLGQNFLADQNIVEKIIGAAMIEKDSLVIEIGPGVGVLTAPAAVRAGKVIGVEIDRKLVSVLKDSLQGFNNVEIIHQDILKTDLSRIIEENEWMNGVRRNSVIIIGNLPYYITTPIIMKVLEGRVPADLMIVTVQKEVAERIVANPGAKAYGALSIAVQYYCDATRVANAPKGAFIPKPKVDSTVIRLGIRKEKACSIVDEAVFFHCVRLGFGQRRKTLLNALEGFPGLSKDEVFSALAFAGIDGGRRAETLCLSEFAALANTIASKNVGNGR